MRKFLVSVLLLGIACGLHGQSNVVTNQISLNFQGDGTQVYLIATTPPDGLSDSDHMHLVATFSCNWTASCNSTIDLTLGNRGGFSAIYTAKGVSPVGLDVHIAAYRQGDNSTNIYLIMENYWDSATYSVLENMGDTVLSSPQNIGTTEIPGTPVFDTQSNPPASYTDYSGNFTANGAINATSILFPGGSGTPTTSLASSNGNIGIGTLSPTALLELYGGPDQITTALADSGSRSSNLALNAADTSYGAGSAITFGNVQSVAAGSIGWAAIKSFLTDGAGNTYGDLAFSTRNNRNDTALIERLRIVANGNIGIGTSSPGARLEVNGNLKLTPGSGASLSFPDGTVQSTAWNGTTLGGDYAESVDVTGDRAHYEPGDVIVINSAVPGSFDKASSSYSRMVAGVYSTRPGLVGRRTTADRPNKDAEVPMAMMGIVPTKVSTENGLIEPGDLLVSSSTPGYAMKGTDRDRLTGAIIGKALAPLKSGSGVIEVLLALQ